MIKAKEPSQARPGSRLARPGQAPGRFLPDMLKVASEGLVDVEQEDKVWGLLQMGLLA